MWIELIEAGKEGSMEGFGDRSFIRVIAFPFSQQPTSRVTQTCMHVSTSTHLEGSVQHGGDVLGATQADLRHHLGQLSSCMCWCWDSCESRAAVNVDCLCVFEREGV